jgi:hypothetical protein
VKSYFDRFIKHKLIQQGFSDDFTLSLDTSDPFVHSITISHPSLEGHVQNTEMSFLIRIFVRRRDMLPSELLTQALNPVKDAQFDVFRDAFTRALTMEPPSIDHPSESVKVSFIEYIYLQNPLAQFKEHQSPLPSQLYPSLGCGREVLEMLAAAASEHRRDALLNRPEHFHNALLYNRMGFRFVLPAFQVNK